MSTEGFMDYARIDYGVYFTKAEAEKFIRVFFATYPALKKYHKETIEFCRKHGYVDSPLGRRRRLPDINSKNVGVRHYAERQAVNHRIQSPSSDTVVIAANEILKEPIDPKECKPVLFIHDELIFEVRDNSKLIDYAKIVKHHMENPPLFRDYGLKLSVPLVADAKVGYNAAEMKKLDL
jgi:DNA polymerase-1